MPDYAWLRSGASVVYGPILGEHRLEKLTSDTLAQSVLPWAPFVLHVLRMPG